MPRDFATVYEQEVWPVYGFFAYRLSSVADAEDLTQRTFERALRAWKRFDPERSSARTCKRANNGKSAPQSSQIAHAALIA